MTACTHCEKTTKTTNKQTNKQTNKKQTNKKTKQKQTNKQTNKKVPGSSQFNPWKPWLQEQQKLLTPSMHHPLTQGVRRGFVLMMHSFRAVGVCMCDKERWTDEQIDIPIQCMNKTAVLANYVVTTVV